MPIAVALAAAFLPPNREADFANDRQARCSANAVWKRSRPHKRITKNAFAAQKLWSCSRIKETGFRFYTSIVLDALRICAALADAGAEAKRRSFRFGRRRRCLPSRRSALSRCAAPDAPKCLFAFTAGPKALSTASAPICAGTAAQRHKALPIEQKSGSEEECAAAAGLSASAEAKTQAYAARAPARRPAGRRCAGPCEKTERIGAFSHPSAQRRVPAPPHMECRYARGISEKQACTDAACAYVQVNAASTAAALLGKVRLRNRSARADSARALCAFRRDVSGNAAAESGKAVFAANKKSVCGAQPQTLIVHPFFSRRGRTEG